MLNLCIQFSSYTRWSSVDMTSTKFEEIMSKHNMHEKDEFKSIKSLKEHGDQG